MQLHVSALCRPSSGCLENLSYYTMRVVPFCGGGRDLALQRESWKVVTIETNILTLWRRNYFF